MCNIINVPIHLNKVKKKTIDINAQCMVNILLSFFSFDAIQNFAFILSRLVVVVVVSFNSTTTTSNKIF